MAEEFKSARLPSSIEAERAVISSILLDPNVARACTELLSDDDFFDSRLAVIFRAITELEKDGEISDAVSIGERVRGMDTPHPEAVISLLSDLASEAVTTENVRQYVKIVKEKANRRNVIRAVDEVRAGCFQQKESMEDIFQALEKKVFRLIQQRNTDEFTPIQTIVETVIENLYKASRSNSRITGLASGFTDLDNLTTGFQPSDLILIAARPSMGKTAFVLNLAQHVAVKNRETVAIFSLEMSKEQLVSRLLAMQSHVDMQNLRTGKLGKEEWEDVSDGSEEIATSRLIIDDTSSITPNELLSKCRKLKLEHDLKMIIIDYIQLMNGSRKTESRQIEISEISRALKGIARELSVPVIALSQLSRGPEQRADHRPMLSDLRESGAIEQDADLVMFLYRDEYYNKDTEEKGVTEVIVAKQRNGPIATVKLSWIASQSRFANMDHPT